MKSRRHTDEPQPCGAFVSNVRNPDDPYCSRCGLDLRVHQDAIDDRRLHSGIAALENRTGEIYE
jgi:hypothetical protein